MKKAAWVIILATVMAFLCAVSAAYADELTLGEAVTWTPAENGGSIGYTYPVQSDGVYELRVSPANDGTVTDGINLNYWGTDRVYEYPEENARRYVFYGAADHEIQLELSTWDYSDTTAFTVTLSYSDEMIVNSSGGADVPYDTWARLHVDVISNDPFTCQWGTLDADGTKTPIAGKTGLQCTVEHVQQYARYYCDVDNGHTAKTLEYEVAVQNGLHVSPEPWWETDYSIPVDGEISLTVTGSCQEGEISYQWYKDDAAIDGAVNPHFQASSAAGSGYYLCEGRDQYGNTSRTSFSVTIENNLTALRESRYMLPDGTVKAKVNVTAVDTEGLEYQWFFRNQMDDGKELIEGITGPELVLTGMSEEDLPLSLSCEVTDRFGNTVSVSDGLEIWDVYTVSADLQANQAWLYPGQHYTIRIYDPNAPMPLTCQWYRKAEEEDEYELIPEADGLNLLIEGAEATVTYKCVMTDETGLLHAENEFTAYMNNGCGVAVDGEDTFTIYPEQEVTLRVIAYNCRDVVYTWSRETDGETVSIPGADSAGVTLNDVTASSRIFCSIFGFDPDENEYESWVEFQVNVDNQLNVTQEKEDYADGTGATLRVYASCLTDTLSYSWSRSDPETGEHLEIPGADEPVYEAEDILTPNHYFYCTVSDGYGAEETVEFNVSGSYRVQRIRISESPVRIQAGDPVTLEVLYSSNAGTLDYCWYVEEPAGSGEWYEIENSNNSTITVPEVIRNSQFKCVVTGDCGDSQFEEEVYLNVETELNVETGEQDQFITIAPNEAFTMTPDINCPVPSLLSYSWFERNDDWSETELDVYSESLTLNDVTQGTNYICRVTSPSTTYEYFFHVYVDNRFDAEADGNQEIEVFRGEAVSVKVMASCLVGTPVYEWTYDGSTLESTGPSLALPVNGESGEYWCHVADPFNDENSRDIRFSVYYRNEPLPASVTRMLLPGEPADTVPDEENDNISWFRFIPEQTKYYRIWSESASGQDPYATLYDDQMNEITAADDNYSERDFEINWVLQAGKTYYLAARNYNNSAEVFQVKVETTEVFFAEAAESSYHDVVYGAAATLEVIAGPNAGDMTYTWGIRDEEIIEEIENAAGASYTTGPITAETYYYCLVSDGYHRQVIEFTVRPVAELRIIPAGYEYLDMMNNETLTLTVSAESAAGGITCQWFRQETNPVTHESFQEMIVGATELTYAVRDPEHRDLYYVCQVKDEAGNHDAAHFHVTVNGAMTLEAVGDTSRTVRAGDSVTLKVEPVDAGQNVEYRWSKELFDEDWNPLYINEFIGEGQEITLQITENSRITCSASDDFDGAASAAFEVQVSDYFSADSRRSWFGIAPGESITAEVDARSDHALSYAWYGPAETMYQDETEQIAGADRDHLTVTDIEKNAYYFCRVQDEAGNQKDIWFTVCIENDLEAWGDTTEIYTDAGEPVTMTVNTNIPDVEYQWYGPAAEEGLLNKADRIEHDSAQYTTNEYPGYSTWYRCVVKDEYGNTKQVDFRIIARSTLTVSAEGSDYPECLMGDPLTMKVNAEGFGTLTYIWAEITADEYGQQHEEILEAAGDECTVIPALRAEYRCRVTDNFDGSLYVDFRPQLDDPLTVEAVSETDLTVEAGDGFTLEVNAQCHYGEISYQWYEKTEDQFGYSGNKKLTGETYAQMAVEEADHAPARYFCRVQNEYGHVQESETFYVSIENYLESETEYETYLTVLPTEEAVLNVTATCREGVLTYQWYADGRAVTEAAADQTEYRVSGLENPEAVRDYSCVIRDQYGNSLERYFHIRIDNRLEAIPDGDEGEYGPTELAVSPGESINLKVNVTAEVMDGIACEWHKSTYNAVTGGWSEYELIEGETGNSISTGELTARTMYWFRVTDVYGNEQYVYFNISIDNKLHAWPDGDEGEYGPTDFTVTPGESIDLKVNVTAEVMDGITCEWYRNTYHAVTGDWSGYELIEGETGDSISTGELTVRTLYEFHVRDIYGNEQYVDFNIFIDNKLRAWPDGDEGEYGPTDFTITPGESIDLKVNVTAEVIDGITYEWYKDTYNVVTGEWSGAELIEGETGDSISTGELTTRTMYWFRVTDVYGNEQSVIFNIFIDNKLHAWPDGAAEDVNYMDLTVMPGEDVHLKVNVEAMDKTGITYRWRRKVLQEEGYWNWTDWEEMEGVAGDSVTVENAAARTDYEIRIRDAYGNEQYVYFYIGIENNLHLWWDGEPEDEASMSISVLPGEGLNLKVNVTADDLTGMVITWSKETYDVEHGVWSGHEEIEGATGVTLETGSITAATVYAVRVEDKYANYRYVYGHISIDNDFHVWPDGEAEDTYEKYLSVMPGEDVDLRVNVTAHDLTGMTYHWRKSVYSLDERSWTSWEDIGEATGECVTVNDNMTKAQYEVHVSDAYGNEQYVYYYINIENGFSAYTTENSFTVAPADTVEMVVTADCTVGELVYQWYKYGYYDQDGDWHDEEEIEGVNEPSYTSEPVTRRTDYYCYVRDMYGNTTNVWFNVYIENHLTAEAVESERFVELNSTATMIVDAHCDAGSIFYEWHRCEYWDEDGEIWYGEPIEGATEASYTCDPVTNRTGYYCELRDEYGNSTRVDFTIGIENHLNVTAVQSMQTVPLNDPVTMAVETSCDHGAVTTYVWLSREYDDDGSWYDSEIIQGADGPTCTIESVSRYHEYICVVTDEYENQDEALFSVYIENDFTAEAVQSELTVKQNRTVTMEVRTTGDDASVTYEWYQDGYADEEGYWHDEVKIHNAAGAAYTSEPVTRNTEYHCIVKDSFGNPTRIGFSITVDDEPESGTCGEHAAWTLDGDGVLRITGTGPMDDYDYDRPAPWEEYRSLIRTVVIESGITRIGDRAFQECSALISVSVPATVTSIGDMVCWFCSGLQEFQIPNGVTTLGGDLFYGSGLRTIDIPESVVEIGNDAFIHCTFLSAIHVAADNPQFASVDGVLFSKDLGRLLAYPGGKDGDYTIPSDVHTICTNAFADVAELDSLTVPGTVKTIERFAFWQCNMSDISLEEGIKTIGVGAFNNVHIRSNSIYIPASVEEIGVCAFYMASLNVEVSPDNPSYASLGGALYDKNFSRLMFYPDQAGPCMIPDTVRVIDPDAFAYAYGLTNVIISDGVTEIPEEAFLSCYHLTAVTIPATVTSIGMNAFANCDSLTDIYYTGTMEEWQAVSIHAWGNDVLQTATVHPESAGVLTGACEEWGYPTGAYWMLDSGVLTVYGDGYIPDCWFSGGMLNDTLGSTVRTLIIEEGITRIGDMSFFNTPNLGSISIPNTVGKIGMSFLGCNELTEVTIPASVTEIHGQAFWWNARLAAVNVAAENPAYTSLDGVLYNKDVTTLLYCPSGRTASVTIPDTVKTIGQYAFSDTWGQTEIIIPAGVTTIEAGAFNGARALPGFTVQEGSASFAATDGVLLNKDKTQLIAYPAGRTAASYRVPDGVRVISDHAFAYPQNLKEVVLPDSVTLIQRNAFYLCEKLEKVTIPESVTSIEEDAFYDCHTFTIVCKKGSAAYDYAVSNNISWIPLYQTILTLPEGLTTIESEAFRGVPAEAIRIPAGVISIAADAFDEDAVLILPEDSDWIEWAENNHYLWVTENE